MLRVLNGTQMQETDRYTIEQMGMSSMVLMEKAAEAVVSIVLKETTDRDRILIVCGSGNNGADGVAAARMLHLKGRHAALFLAGNQKHLTKESVLQWQIAGNYGVDVVNNPQWTEYTVIIDAMFGTGLSREVSGKYAEIIRKINRSPAKVYAVDIPSGIHAGTGQVLGEAVNADCTVTFAFYKAGCLLYPGASFCGKLILSDVGIYAMDSSYVPDIQLLEKTDLMLRKKRRPDGNKGTFGKVLLIAGNEEIYGAAYMSAKAAFLSGAGMVKILTSAENCALLKQSLPEAMTEYVSLQNCGEKLDRALYWADFVGIGPGIGTDGKAQKMVQYVLSQCDKPLVMDADALNVVSRFPEWLIQHKGEIILTPHVGEMSRLWNVSAAELKKDPFTYAGQASRRFGAVVVLKDARTCIAKPEGQMYLHAFGNSGMATAGSGDVLTGTILGQLGVCDSVSQGACMGVLLHGLAGDLAAEEKGETSLTAMDICKKLPDILKQFS